MRIAFLGAGTWGYCLASLLAENGHQVNLWTRNPQHANYLNLEKKHPKLHQGKYSMPYEVKTDLEEVLKGAECIVEAVTTKGIRPVFEAIKGFGVSENIPIVTTSKGIENKTGLLLFEVIREVLGEATPVACIGGPSHAEEVIRGQPTTVVAASEDPELAKLVSQLFNTDTFRVYPNFDIRGVAFGGAMKNVIGIACGISDGLGFGDNSKAAIMTRGLHEIRKLAESHQCRIETLNGLSGLGDLCVTCLSTLSRNYRFGYLIAQGKSPEEAKDDIGMVVEGAYTVFSAWELGQKYGVELPITEAVREVIQGNLKPFDAAKSLMAREIKEETI